ncbi:hypothetical protein [Hyalangium rubrum]|uniref:Recombinase zinc beta ribbon domain-containing protein n=1 Tax=Hyalangium rubrum TaxID=3103134 RepID=A0ABU5HHL3_9BACT|nr:hypothetical protein [Hyalangium sp. s54d21]MDY7232952.1 hypothetical protein [Hyalangium sp. s54d21]
MQGEMFRSESLVPTTRRAYLTADLLKEEREQRQLLGQYVKQCMVEGTDYGRIPGMDKPTLLKPGAEKLIDLFRCTPEFTLVPDFSREDFEGGFFKYTFRCRILSRDTGAVMAEGYGSANSRESRFRWRTANRTCPTCGKAAIIQGKAEYGGGWVCFKKRGGCGEKYVESDERITVQPVGRVENENIADVDNTILKMAKKRAQVDGAIALARCSDMFTQDVEDMPAAELSAVAPPVTGAVSAPGPTVEASPRISAVAFGPYKGKAISEMSDEELSASIDLAHSKLQEQPKAKWAKAMRENLAALESEVELRCRAPHADGAHTGLPQ